MQGERKIIVAILTQVCYIIFMIKKGKKTLGTNILVERDMDGGFIVSIPGISGAHADGMTLEQAVKNLNEVMSLLKEYYGEKKLLRIIESENRFFGVIPYNLEYV